MAVLEAPLYLGLEDKHMFVDPSNESAAPFRVQVSADFLNAFASNLRVLRPADLRPTDLRPNPQPPDEDDLQMEVWTSTQDEYTLMHLVDALECMRADETAGPTAELVMFTCCKTIHNGTGVFAMRCAPRAAPRAAPGSRTRAHARPAAQGRQADPPNAHAVRVPQLLRTGAPARALHTQARKQAHRRAQGSGQVLRRRRQPALQRVARMDWYAGGVHNFSVMQLTYPRPKPSPALDHVR